MKPDLKNERGIALFLVLWILALLTVIAAEFCYTIRTEVDITRNFKEETQAYYIASAGVFWMIGELVVNEYLPHPVSTPDSVESSEDLRWRLSYDMPPVPFGAGRFKVKKTNESGKVNLNRAGRSLLMMMLNNFEIDEDHKEIIVDSIMDWRDKNGLTHPNGAENDYYQSLPEPYKCKNDDFTTIEELLLVRGITPSLFYGGLKDLVTVYQDEESSEDDNRKRKAMVDFNRININAASPQMLRSLPGMSPEMAASVMAFREKKDFRSRTEFYKVVGAETYKALSTYITLKPSPYYTLESTGMLGDGRAREGVAAVVRIDRKIKKGYEIIQWIDSLEYLSGQ